MVILSQAQNTFVAHLPPNPNPHLFAHFHFSLSCIGEGNGNHSSVFAWRVPGMGKPGGLPFMGSHRVGHD